jgi:hypothetical protein
MEPDWEQTGIRTIIFFGGGEETDPERGLGFSSEKQEMKL